MDMKTRLMIDANKVERLFVDGPSLVIGLHAAALTRLPLRRLRSVIVVGILRHGLEALLHCAEQQIPVLFCDARGNVKTQILPYRQALFHWDDWLESLGFDPVFDAAYRQWLTNQQWHLRSLIQRDLDSQFDESKPWRVAMLECCLNHRLKSVLSSKQQQDEARDWLAGLMRVHLNELLSQQGLKPHHLGAERILTDFATDLERLARHRQVQWLQNHSCPINAKWMSICYQSIADELEQHILRICLQLRTLIEHQD
jgi:hypothetical protein